MRNLTKSTRPISEKDITHDWHIVNIQGKVLGRAVPDITRLLMGKHKINYVNYLDAGDYVVVINAGKVKLTGRKHLSKIYSYYSGYPSGLRKVAYGKMIDKNPTEVIKRAVSGMLPKNKLRDRRMARFYIFADDKHPYEEKISPKGRSTSGRKSQ